MMAARRDQRSTDLNESIPRSIELLRRLELEGTAAARIQRSFSRCSSESDPRSHLRFSSESGHSTSSSFAERMNAARVAKRTVFPVIGRGSAGTILEIPGTQRVIKYGFKFEMQLWNDFIATNVAYTAVCAWETKIRESIRYPISVPRVPRAFEFHPSDDNEYWHHMRQHLPADEAQDKIQKETPCALVIQRILPLQEETRIALIQRFFAENIQEKALLDDENRACLVRVYLGRRTPNNMTYVSLQNFELHIDQMEDLGLEPTQFAKEIAVGLAILHWEANINGTDIEFVLGTSASPSLPHNRSELSRDRPQAVYEIDFRRRNTHIWMLDFDKTEPFDLLQSDEAIVNLLVPAVHGNDPYVPRPSLDSNVWAIFKEAYIGASQLILASKQQARPGDISHLPEAFMKRLEKAFADQDEFEQNADHHILFEDEAGEAIGEDQGWGSDELDASDDEEDEDEEDEDDHGDIVPM